VTIFTRKLVLVDADESTRDFYAEQGRSLAPAAPMDEEPPPPVKREHPPHLGIGSEEDSLTSCVGSLLQKPPKKVHGDDKILRYLARFITNKPEDADREFVISYFLFDKSVSIHEPPKRNSGIVGGSFTKRVPVKKVANEAMTEGSFFVGATVGLVGNLFLITDTDSGTLDYMEEHSAKFPYSDFPLVMERAAKQLGDAATDGSFEKACADASSDGGTFLDAEGFKSVMEMFDLASPEQQCITMFRSLSEGGLIPIDSLVDELMS